MFFEESYIAELMLCLVCKRVFVDPRILPCGETICERCVCTLTNAVTEDDDMRLCSLLDDDDHEDEEATRSPQLVITCLCGSFHTIVSSQLPVDKSMLSLLATQPSEVYRNATAYDLSVNLKQIAAEKTLVEQRVEQRRTSAQQYYEAIRAQLAVSTEQVVAEIDTYHDDFIGKLAVYESECLKSLQKNPINENHYRELIDESQAFCSRWSSYLDNFDIDDEALREALADAKQRDKMLNKANKQIEGFTYNGKIVSFRVNKTAVLADMIGSLEI